MKTTTTIRAGGRVQSLRVSAISAVLLATAAPAFAAAPLHVYGPGGPLPAMREAAAAFGKAHGVEVVVTAGPTPKWIDAARKDADVVFSGSETMMSDFRQALPAIDPASVRPLYLRAAAILVRPGNLGRIHGLADLLTPGHRILVVNGAGQQGLWEDVAGRRGDIASVRAFRANIAVVAATSAQAKAAWTTDPSLDAWLIWTIWQKANPTLADQVAIEPDYAVYRDVGVALTHQGETRPEAKAFAAYLASPAGAAVFERWGWLAPR